VSGNAGDGLQVTFRLDGSLGPNRVDVLLVMCRFAVDLSGQFAVVVNDTAFQVAGVDISGEPFRLTFADDFWVDITDLHVGQDPDAPVPVGHLAPAGQDGQFLVEGQVPLLVRMQAHLSDTTLWIAFRTPFLVSGMIDGSAIHLTGRFEFHMEGYDAPGMRTKLGICQVLLNASSLMYFRLARTPQPQSMRLAFAQREADLAVEGSFAVGLDGLDVRVLDLSLEATPLHFPGVLETGAIEVDLDRDAVPVPVDFRVEDGPHYRLAAVIPARLSTHLAFHGFAPQPLDASMRLALAGRVALDSRLRLDLHEQVEVTIGDGQVTLDVEARLAAEAIEPGELVLAEEDGRRRLYAALQAVPRGPYGRRIEPLRRALALQDRTARLLAVDALARRGGAVTLSLLASALEDPAPEVRVAAANAIGRLGAERLVARLFHAFQTDPDENVRLAALLALGQLELPLWQDAAQAALADPHEVLRCQAALLIGRKQPAPLRPALFDALSDPSPFVGLCAGMGLVETGDNEAVETVARLTQEDEDVCVQMIGCITLGQTQHPLARHTLQAKLASTEDVFVRQAALYALARQERRPP
jgi:hypothetical protein